MIKVNLLENKALYKPAIKLNTLEYSIYITLLITIVFGTLALGLYSMYLINTTDFLAIIK